MVSRAAESVQNDILVRCDGGHEPLRVCSMIDGWGSRRREENGNAAVSCKNTRCGESSGTMRPQLVGAVPLGAERQKLFPRYSRP
jgi:hypothetical protein